MKIVKLTIPLDVFAKSLFKDTVGNNLGTKRPCMHVNMIPTDQFVKVKN